MLLVVEVGSTGVGGDCLAMIAMGGDTEVRAFNVSGRAPAALKGDALRGQGIAAIARSSPHAVTVPGAVGAWCRLVDDFGRMEMSEILQPRINALETETLMRDQMSTEFERRGFRVQPPPGPIGGAQRFGSIGSVAC